MRLNALECNNWSLRLVDYRVYFNVETQHCCVSSSANPECFRKSAHARIPQRPRNHSAGKRESTAPEGAKEPSPGALALGKEWSQDEAP